jgi:hypothetical protein
MMTEDQSAEIRNTRYLVQYALSYHEHERDWAMDDWKAFYRVMSREGQAALFELTPEQFERCLRAAFVLLTRSGPIGRIEELVAPIPPCRKKGTMMEKLKSIGSIAGGLIVLWLILGFATLDANQIETPYIRAFFQALGY